MQTLEPLIPCPQQHLLLLAQRVERCMDRKTELIGIIHQCLLPTPHLLSLPAGNSTFINRFRLVRNNQILINTRNHTYTTALRTRTYRIIEIKQVLTRLDKLNPVRFKTLREHFLLLVHPDPAFSVPLKKRCLHTVRKTVTRRLLVIHNNTVH